MVNSKKILCEDYQTRWVDVAAQECGEIDLDASMLQGGLGSISHSSLSLDQSISSYASRKQAPCF